MSSVHKSVVIPIIGLFPSATCVWRIFPNCFFCSPNSFWASFTLSEHYSQSCVSQEECLLPSLYLHFAPMSSIACTNERKPSPSDVLNGLMSMTQKFSRLLRAIAFACLCWPLFINLCTFATFHVVLQMRSARLLVALLEDISALLTGMTKYRKGPQRTAKDPQRTAKDHKGALHRTTEDRQSWKNCQTCNNFV